ncbi:MAG TPA: Gfo/Idh/MocA family oxidoreductase, partial [Ilumatobacteraceae bacterium]|nr:Gfo/Idh/MocA family oxidoreductase [Ilumatobacteraceae bacterium]
TGDVTNEDYIGAMCVFESGARGTFEACRSMVGPESQNLFEIYGTGGSIRWNFEQMNQLQVYIAGDDPHTGFTNVYGGDRFPHHGNFVPGSANGIGFEDLICIEDHEFLTSVAAGRTHVPGFAEAVAYVSVQDAILRSWESGKWEDVRSLREDDA